MNQSFTEQELQQIVTFCENVLYDDFSMSHVEESIYRKACQLLGKKPTMLTGGSSALEEPNE